MKYINMISFNDFITGNTNVNNFINFFKNCFQLFRKH